MHDLREFDDVVARIRSGLSAVHYRRPSPVRPARSRRALSLAGALSVVAGVAAFVILGPSGGSTPAWADQPRKLTAEQTERITRACTLGDPDLAASMPPPAVIDWRGIRVVAFFADEHRMVECVLDPVAGDNFEFAGGVGGEYAPSDLRVVNTDPHISYSAQGIESSYQVGYRFAVLVGRVGPEVQRVTVDVPGRGDAEASLNDGWVSIWWPGEVDGATLHAFDARGRELASEPLSLD
jgi:hypothetical protein